MFSKDTIRFIVQTPTSEGFDLAFKTTKSIKQLRDAIRLKYKTINPTFKIVSDGILIEDDELTLYSIHQNKRCTY
jgi:hypothetical protein